MAKFDPCFYSPSPSSRFSSAACPILYLGDKTVTVFWEIFWDELGPLAEPDRLLSRNKLISRDLVSVNAKRSFRVFDATNARVLKAVSATPGTFTASYDICQTWALAIMNHPDRPEGILYPSARHKGGLCLALFEGRTICADLDFADQATAEEASAIRSLLTREKIGLV